jgi:hypothetical protein
LASSFPEQLSITYKEVCNQINIFLVLGTGEVSYPPTAGIDVSNYCKIGIFMSCKEAPKLLNSMKYILRKLLAIFKIWMCDVP